MGRGPENPHQFTPQQEIYLSNIGNAEQVPLSASLGTHWLRRFEEYIPDERTRVGYLIDTIECSYADVCVAIAAIRLDDTLTVLRNYFDRTVTLLIPVDPVGNKTEGNCPLANISFTAALKSL